MSTPLPAVAERFLRYVQVDTQSSRHSKATPSSEKQKDLGRLLLGELRDLGVEAEMDEWGYVYARLAATPTGTATPAIALLAHLDTSPDEPGGPVKPLVHRSYDGTAIALPGDPNVKLDPARSPELLRHRGHDLITSDGTTLLGSDDKAGVAVIMQLVADLLAEPQHPRPPLCVCFTVDEEIGRGVDKLDRERLGAAVAYTVDGGEVGTIDTETFNAAEATATVQGVNVHPGYAKGVMANALTILAELLAMLPAAETPEATAEREGYYCPYESSGTIARAQARILLRDFTTTGLEQKKLLLQNAVAHLRVKHPRAELVLEIEDNYRNMRDYILAADPRAITFAIAAGRTVGLDLREERVRGGTDGSRLSEQGLPTPNIFTGGHDYHSRFEWNTVQNLETTLRYVKSLVRYWAQHGHEK
jgi:tripeptide aminopeptidase